MPEPRLIYHFTHLKNLPVILKEGALIADSLVQGTQKLQVEVGDLSVKSRRRTMHVTCNPGGCPSDYVPFYFAPRSPMLFKIHKGGVPQYQDGQEHLIYLVSDVDLITKSELQWVFTDGNCAADLTEYFNDVTQLEGAVDWPLMKEVMWKDTAEDPDRMRRRMAEFLVYQRFPLDLLRGIATMTSTVENGVKAQLQEHGFEAYVGTRRGWYY